MLSAYLVIKSAILQEKQSILNLFCGSLAIKFYLNSVDLDDIRPAGVFTSFYELTYRIQSGPDFEERDHPKKIIINKHPIFSAEVAENVEKRHSLGRK